MSRTPKFSDKPLIGRIILYALDRRGITQREFAEQNGFNVSHLNQIISGKSSPTLRVIHKIAAALDIDEKDIATAIMLSRE